MCLAMPAEVLSIDNTKDVAVVALEGIKKEISLSLVDDISVGDFVLVHVGYALNKVSTGEAERTLALMAQAGLETRKTEEELA